MNHDCTPYADLGAEFQPPLMFFYDEVCDIEPEAAPSHVDPGREKRFAEIRKVFGWDTMTFVTHGEGHFIAVPLSRGGKENPSAPLRRQRLNGVKQQIGNDLFELERIPADKRQLRIQLGDNINFRLPAVGAYNGEGGVGNPVQVQIGTLLVPVAQTVVTQVLYNPFNSDTAPEDTVDCPGDLFLSRTERHPAETEITFVPGRFGQQRKSILPGFFQILASQPDNTVRIVDFVRHAGDQETQRGHTVGLDQLGHIFCLLLINLQT